MKPETSREFGRIVNRNDFKELGFNNQWKIRTAVYRGEISTVQQLVTAIAKEKKK